jgi:hypothetical protein
MNQEFPPTGAPQEDQDLDSERAVVYPTGDDRVDAAVAPLTRLPGLPNDEHVAVLEEVHGRLRDILSELDEVRDPPGPGDPGAAGRR